MTLEIRLAPEEEALLREHAVAAGQDVQTFVREATRRRGLSVDDIDALADRARKEYWGEKSPPPSPQT